MNEATSFVDKAQHWSWEAWFAAAALALIMSIVFAARYLVAKQEEVWGSWMHAQADKDLLLREMVKDSRETNATMVRVIERNTLTIEHNTATLEQVAVAIKARPKTSTVPLSAAN